MKTTIMIALALLAGGATDVEASGVTQNTPVSISIQSGEFSLQTPQIKDFEGVILKERAETYTTSFEGGNFKVKDLRGTQAGWRVDVAASQFSSGRNFLPKGSLTLKPTNSITRVGEGEGEAPTHSMSQAMVIDNGGVEVIKAAKGAGLGVWDFNFPAEALTINVDPTTAVSSTSGETYTSTLKWDLVQAP